MKITLIQSDIVWADPRANGEKLRKALATDPGADLYVLPEMFSTGFNSIAEENGVTLGLMRELAALGNCAIAGSVAVREGESVYNRFYFVKPDGSEEQVASSTNASILFSFSNLLSTSFIASTKDVSSVLFIAIAEPSL